MKIFRPNKRVLKNCKIYGMLKAHADGQHLSFHTPGHKAGAWDITELSFSDNLSCPRGVIAEAERDVSEILGAHASFILTDGSTSGVLSMLKAAADSGVKKIALPASSHKSAFNGCDLLGIKPLLIDTPRLENIPLQPPMSAMNEALKEADALFLTCPDYYGNIPELGSVRALCDKQGKLLLIDGAHGGHLHFDRRLYAGAYADLWVDGVHKSLPALTQGAVVSARTAALAEALRSAADVFRTTSPSYPIMASVEYAVKYPRNEKLKGEVLSFINEHPDRIYFGGDWTKLCVRFGEEKLAFAAEKYFEASGIYPEFCDGSVILFYLSPATTEKSFRRLKKALLPLFSQPLPAPCRKDEAPEKEIFKSDTERIPLSEASGRICAASCGLFPPCTPLLFPGETITEEKIKLLEKADNVFGLKESAILVYKTNTKNEGGR